VTPAKRSPTTFATKLLLRPQLALYTYEPSLRKRRTEGKTDQSGGRRSNFGKKTRTRKLPPVEEGSHNKKNRRRQPSNLVSRLLKGKGREIQELAFKTQLPKLNRLHGKLLKNRPSEKRGRYAAILLDTLPSFSGTIHVSQG